MTFTPYGCVDPEITDAMQQELGRLLELPVAVLPWVRWPYIGTSLSLLPDQAGRLLTRALALSTAPVVVGTPRQEAARPVCTFLS